MTLVTFMADIYPYCAGDVVEIDSDAKKAVDATAKLRDIENPYVVGSFAIEDDKEDDHKEEQIEAQLEQDEVNATESVEAQNKKTAKK